MAVASTPIRRSGAAQLPYSAEFLWLPRYIAGGLKCPAGVPPSGGSVTRIPAKAGTPTSADSFRHSIHQTQVAQIHRTPALRSHGLQRRSNALLMEGTEAEKGHRPTASRFHLN